MEIKFIGTGSGKVSLKRFHSSFIISAGGFNLLVDAGDGISRALLQQNILYNSIDGVVFSHLHPDHYTGFATLLVQMKMQNRRKSLKVFVHKSLTRPIMYYMRNSYLFFNQLGFDFEFIEFSKKELTVVSDKIRFFARQNTHIEIDPDISVTTSSKSFLFNVDGQIICYTGDVGTKDDLYLFKDADIDTMICEVTHVSLEDILDAYEEMKVGKLYLTHISDEDETAIEHMIGTLSEKDKEKIIPAKDGMTIKIK